MVQYIYVRHVKINTRLKHTFCIVTSNCIERATKMFGFGGGGPPQNHTKLYNILEVDQKADSGEIKKAFRKLALVHHPDKGGDIEKFKDIQKAYEILSDDNRRQMYDATGQTDDSPQQESQFPGFGFPDMFQNFHAQKRQEAFPLSISLEDLYNGVTKKIRLRRTVLCGDCGGKGGKNVKKCHQCKGSKMESKRVQLGPGMIQEIRRPCMMCKGQGQIPESVCKSCKGVKVVNKSEEVSIPIRKGQPVDQPIVLENMGDERPGTSPGDLYIILQPKEHKDFKLKKDDLIYEHTMTLSESLTGCYITVNHLDGSPIVVTFNNIVEPGSVFRVAGKGMNRKGHLYIKMNVLFPKALSDDQKTTLRDTLPYAAPSAMPDDAESVDPVLVESKGGNNEEEESQPSECRPS